MRNDAEKPLLTYTEKSKARARELRYYPTINEDRLWQKLRRHQLGVHFRRQAPVGSYIVDFLSIEAMLVVELDGPTHLTEKSRAYDARRDGVLHKKGLKTLRFSDDEAMKNLDGIVRNIAEEVQARIEQ